MKKIILLSILLIFSIACSNNKTSGNYDNSGGRVVVNNDTCKLIDNYLTKLSAEKNFSGGILIVKDGKKILSKGYGFADKENSLPFTPRTLGSIGSITKAFTAAGIMKLAEQNKLTAEDPLKKFFPDIPADKANITIHQLLTHSSGFHEFLENDGGDFEKITTKDFLQRAFAEPLSFKPGEKAVYTNVGMSILAIIIEQISDVDYEEYLRKNLFEPVGINNIGYHYPLLIEDTVALGYQDGKPWGTHQQHFEKAGGGPFWNLKGNGGLEVSLNDMFLWINGFTNHTILSEASIKKMFSSQIQEEGYNGMSFFGYGCNISKSRRNTKMIDNGGSNGIYFARLIRLPEEGVVFYMITNESSINTNMVLPNVTQLYFQGKILQDAMTMQPRFENKFSKQIYEILQNTTATDLELELQKENITVDDDMILLEVGEKLMQDNKNNKALILYKYYTKMFPKIVVAWNDLGDVHQSLNNKEDALKCYKQALKIRPGNERAKDSINSLTK